MSKEEHKNNTPNKTKEEASFLGVLSEVIKNKISSEQSGQQAVDQEGAERVLLRRNEKKHGAQQIEFGGASQKVINRNAPEAKWGGASSHGKWVFVIAAILVAVLLVSVLIIRMLSGGDSIDQNKAGRDDTKKPNSKELAVQLEKERWFHENMILHRSQAVEILSHVFSDLDKKSKSELVDEPDSYLLWYKNMKHVPQPRLDEENEYMFKLAYLDDNTPYLTFDCRDEAYTPFRAYFVRVGDKLKLEWKATVAASDISIEKSLQNDHPIEDSLIRCYISRKEEFYIDPYNDRDHSVYRLTDSNRLDQVWAYVERGSQLDEELKRLLDHGRFVVDLKRNQRVTLRIKRVRYKGMPSQFEINSLVHKDWISSE